MNSSATSQQKLFTIIGMELRDDDSRLVYFRVLPAESADEAKAIGAYETKSALVALHLVLQGEPTSDTLNFKTQVTVVELGAFPYVKGLGVDAGGVH